MLQAMVLIAPISLPLQQIRYALRIKINPFIEGQPLQQELGKSLSDWSREKFQSLYRGTAFATVLGLTQSLWLKGFNPSIEGQPLQR